MEYLGNLRKGFLCESAHEDGKKKMHDKIDIMSNNSVEREIH